MCRFVVYQGRPIILSDVLLDTENSLITQSKYAKKHTDIVNGDGFGIGWYPLHDDSEPAVFIGVQPAWSSRNLITLAEKTQASHFFAHIRDATQGMPISHSNCHPFHYQDLLWMHNGEVLQFSRIKRSLINFLSEEAYHTIRGSTDSEHLFALFIHHISAYKDHGLENIKKALLDTFESLKTMLKDAGIAQPSTLNIAVSAGHGFITTRYVTDDKTQPQSLFYGRGQLQLNKDGDFKILPPKDGNEMVIVASEPLTCFRDDWIKVERNVMVIVHPDNEIELQDL